MCQRFLPISITDLWGADLRMAVTALFPRGRTRGDDSFAWYELRRKRPSLRVDRRFCGAFEQPGGPVGARRFFDPCQSPCLSGRKRALLPRASFPETYHSAMGG